MARKIRYINYGLVMRIIGWLLMIEAAFMLIPLITAIAINNRADITTFAISTGITLLSGGLLAFCLRSGSRDMGRHEGFLLTALVWVFFSLFGMLPFMISEPHIDISSAFFEAMSGFTTTGCTIYSAEEFSQAENIWRCVMQWIGGMGIILFTLAVIPMLNTSGGMQMFNAEVTGITHDKLRPRVSQTAKSLWGLYFMLTIVLIGLLWAGPMSLYDAVCHAFATISTGGFSTHSQSLAYYNSDYVTIVVTLFMFLGGTSFALMFKAIHADVKALRANDVFRAYVGLILIMLFGFVATIFLGGHATNWRDLTIYPLFQIVSTITSTGLTVCNFQAWGPFVMALMMVMMFTGACAGSTSGGAKIDRALILAKNSRAELHRALKPNSIIPLRINRTIVQPEVVNKVIAFLSIYVIVIAIGGICLTAFGLPLFDAFFSSFSCVSNTGFGTGITGYGENFHIIPTAGKWILSALMLIGRLELFTVLVLFIPAFWRK